MQTLLDILRRAGGFRPSLYLKIQNPPFMALVIEAVPELGPLSLPAISAVHYGKMNGDAMRDPEMCFELETLNGGILSLNPYYFRNDYVGVEEWSRELHNGHYYELPDLHEQHRTFARQWDTNLRLQGFLEAFTDAAILG